MSGCSSTSAAVATVVMGSSPGLPTIDPMISAGHDRCPDCHSTEYKVFMAEKRLVECIKCGRVYPADSDVTY